MRLLIVCAVCVLAAPAAAQRASEPQTTGSISTGRIEMDTINGVRVWAPKPPPPAPVVVAPPQPAQQAGTSILLQDEASGYDDPYGYYGSYGYYDRDRRRLGPPRSPGMPPPRINPMPRRR
jgi:hypothetical protein